MAKVTTMAKIWQPLMEGCTVKKNRCCVCGRSEPLNDHHVVKRSAGNLYKDGVKISKPTITLCGFGNNLQDSYGRDYCHGLAHAGMLHFKWVKSDKIAGCGHWEFLKTDEPVKYQKALEMDGWRPLSY